MAKSSITKNFTYQMFYEVLAIILPLITSPYISRVLGAESLGEYSYSYSVAYYFVLFSMLGIKNYGNREIARARDDRQNLNRIFSGLFTVHMIFSLICTFLYIGYIFGIHGGRRYAVIQTAYVISALFDISWFYFGVEKFRLTVMTSSIVKIATVVSVFVFVNSPDDLWKYCAIMAFGMLISQLCLWIPLRRYVRFVKPTFPEITKHIGPLLILFIPALAVSLYKYMDKIMIGSLSDKVQLGYYENAEKANNIPVTMISSFGTVMLPRMSNLVAAGNKKETQRYLSVSMDFIMCLAMALAFGIGAVATVFAPVFWGRDFTECGPLLIGLSVTIPFVSFADVIRTQHLIPAQKDRDYMISVMTGAILNLIINWTFIPRYGAGGAVAGTIAAEISVCLVQAFLVRNELPVKRYAFHSLPFFVFGAMMAALAVGIKSVFGIHIYTLLTQVFIGGSFYFVLCSVYFWKTEDEIFMNLFHRITSQLKKESNKFIR